MLHKRTHGFNALTKKTLLGKTQLLFNSKGMRNMVSRSGDLEIKETFYNKCGLEKKGIQMAKYI